MLQSLAVAKLLPQVADWRGPVFMRLCRNEVPQIFTEAYAPVIGKAVQLRGGSDVTLVCCGVMVARTLVAAAELAQSGVNARVVEVHTIKPLDRESIVRCAAETGALVTVEEHSVIGGLGGAVAETLADNRPTPVVRVGIADTFAESGPYAELLDKYGLAVADIVRAAQRAVELKTGIQRALAPA
ncbi:MAG: transketolase family protein, partial [Chloroflexi bacterium]|nr:transketolase family protein [Chloroflexota bacterium]